MRSLTGGSGQQCCYDSNGDIIVGPPGGGTADLVSPDVSFTEHFFEDVLPFWLCCKAGIFSSCGTYYQHRPSDDCSQYVPPPPPGMISNMNIIIIMIVLHAVLSVQCNAGNHIMHQTHYGTDA